MRFILLFLFVDLFSVKTYQVQWKDLPGVTDTNGSLIKTAPDGWGNGGANSFNTLASNTDGWFQFSIESGTSTYCVGFSNNEGGYNVDALQAGFYISGNGLLYWLELGSGNPIALGSWQVGDLLKVAREGNQLRGYRNGVLLKSVTLDPGTELKVKSIIYYNNTTSPVIRSTFDVQLALVSTIAPVLSNGTGGSIQITPSGGVAPYTYAWSSGETTSTISGKGLGVYSVTVADAAGHRVIRSYSLGYQVQWKDLPGVTDNNGSLIKAAPDGWGNGGANSFNMLASNTDGWLEFSVESGTSTYCVGLSNKEGDYSVGAIQSGFYISGNGILYWLELGSGNPIALGTWQSGDVLKVAREGNQLKGYRNGVELRSVTSDPASELKVKSTIYYNNTTSPAIRSSFDVQLSLVATLIPVLGNGTGGSIQITSSGGVSPYTYVWSSGETTSTISNKGVGAYSVTVTDAVGHSLVRDYSLGHRVQWKDLLGVTNNVGVLTKTAPNDWGNGGANSSNVLAANQDGWVEFTLSDAGSSYAIGFATSDNGFDPSLVLYGIYPDKNGLFYTHAGVSDPYVSMGSWVIGDVFKVSRTGNQIKYYRNGVELKSATVDSNTELKVKSSVYNGVSPATYSSFNSPYPNLVVSGVVSPLSGNGTEGSVQATVSGGVEPYSYKWSSGETTSGIANKGLGTYDVTVTDAVGQSITKNYSIGYRIQWKDLTGVTNNGGVLTKTAPDNWGNGGANSANVLLPSQDGWIEFEVNYTSLGFAIGFGLNTTDFSYSNLVEGIEIYKKTGLFYSISAATEVAMGVWQAGDLFRLARIGNQIKYYRNGVEFKSVSTDPNIALRVKSAIYTGSSPSILSSFDIRIFLSSKTTPIVGDGTGAIEVIASEGTAPYTYQWSSGETTSKIQNKALGTYTVTVTDSASRVITRGYDLGYRVQWKDLTGVNNNRGVLTKTAITNWGNGGANSSNRLLPNTDGWIEFQTTNIDLSYAIGFAVDTTNFNYTNLTQGIEIYKTTGLFYLTAASSEIPAGSWEVGDIFKLARIGNQVKYYRNGVELKSVSVDANTELYVKSAIYTGTSPVVFSSFNDGAIPDTQEVPSDTTHIEIIPKAFLLTREGKSIGSPLERQFMLSALQEGDVNDVFQAPPCLEGDYHIAFQLYYDLGDKQTTKDWSAYLGLTLLHGTDTVWTKPLQVNMLKQTFVSTVFNDSLVSCDDNYRFVVTQKIVKGQIPQDNIYLKILFFENITDVFSASDTVSLTCNYIPGQTTLSWTTKGKNILEYDVEWVYIEKHENFEKNTAVEAFKFKEPVRITTASHVYKHLTYYPTGRLWYRIRAVGTNPKYPDHRIPGYWFYSDCDSIHIDNHQPDMNWQEQTVFAEEGKYKKVMNYFDGSLRQRQAQTNLSTEEITLVAESMYDYEGRKTVDILAVPATDATLKFKSGFNIFQPLDATVAANTSDTHKKFNYDNKRLYNSILSNQSGAGNYYSAANNQATIHRDYIPDAEGYAYSQTEYLNDGTGRVARQSGVGREFAMDSSHVTRNFYANATSEELIRLFGSNVGVATHYKKNLVVDPNGQVSVSYMDQEGRVIATALAGNKPKNVAALESYKNLDLTPLSVNISDKNAIDNGISVTSHKLLNVAVNSTYTFNYDLAALGSKIGAICDTCTYDLKITLTDPDGAPLDLSLASGNQSADKFSYLLKDITAASCKSATTANVQFALVLKDMGDYTITKSLIPHELTFDQMKIIISQDISVKSKIDSINHAYVVNPADCDVCTASCPEADSLINDAINDISALDCDNLYQQMVSFFQAKHAEEDGVFEPSDSLLATHELYCQYKLCVKNQESDVFEKQLARIPDWDAANAAGYGAAMSDMPHTKDPFFYKKTLSGDAFRGRMQGKLNNISIGPIAGRNFKAKINDVVDPNNKAFWINQAGNPDPVNGLHILYMDLMGKRSKLSPESYNNKLNAQRWTLFKSFYLEAKRKTKLEIPEYKNCPAAKQELDRNDDLVGIDTPAKIEAWGNARDGADSVSNVELSTSFNSIKAKCDAKISAPDSILITKHLKSYFLANKQNILRLIYKEDLVGSSLSPIKDILSHYGCGLDSVVQADPMGCVHDTTIVITHKIQHSGSEFQEPVDSVSVQQASSAAALQSGTTTNARLSAVSQSISPLQGSAATDTEKVKTDIIESILHQSIVEQPVQNSANKTSARMALSELTATPLPSPDEYSALVDLYNATEPAWWGNQRQNIKRWNPIPMPGGSQSVENWYGVTVDPETGFIIELDLRGNNLHGDIPASIGNLIHLKHLRLGGLTLANGGGGSGNSLTGGIPSTIGNLKDLMTLDLNGNDITSIPMEMGLLTNLATLDFGYNKLSGPMPSFISDNLNNLQVLDFNNNSFSGPFPLSMAGLSKLRYLNFTGGDFTGAIPSDFNQLLDLEYLYIRGSQDKLTGSIPDFSGSVKLKALEISGHQLTGSIPELNMLNLLESINLSSNNLSGSIPDISALQHLSDLNLSSNNLTGSIPTFVNNAKLASLDLSKNNFTGSIPTISELEVLSYLDLSHNNLTGTIPELSHNLTRVFLSNNQLTSISPQYSSLSIYELELDNNKLSGHIPEGLIVSFTTSGTCGNNKFTFADLEVLAGYSSDGGPFVYWPQDSVDIARRIPIINDQPITLTTSIDRSLDSLCKYQWFKYVDGVHDVALNAQDFDGHTYIITTPTTASVGKYYYTIIYDGFGELTLTSRLQQIVNPTDSATTTFKICLAYNENNSTIKKWSFNADWNDVVARCMANALKEDSILINYAIDKLVEQHVSEFNNTYRTKCLSGIDEKLSYSYIPKEYHYTLYYFDQGGNLAQTVPPKGVKPLSDSLVTAFIGGKKTEPAHELITRYQFSSLNQVLWQKTPDAGESRFYYNDKSQLKLSQNAQQAIDHNYSYTKYDEQGRIIEVGEMNTTASLSTILTHVDDINFPTSELSDLPTLVLSDITRTHYDFPKASIQQQFKQEFLRTRVAYVEVLQKGQTDTLATYYSYDVHGNVKSLIQHIPGLSAKRTDYVYDLISGKVNYVMYQYGKSDQFIHRYDYDADNRIRDVYSSTDAFIWDKEATYFYYMHGPLARVELGEYRVQGLDYYYSLQGWIKGVNMPYEADPGQDGYNGSVVGRDAFAYTLGYYQGDYKPVNDTITLSDTRDQLWARYNESMNNNGFFNGNISWMTTDLKKIGQQKGSRAKGMQAMVYQYDQLHRIVQSRSLTQYNPLSSGEGQGEVGFVSRTGTSAYDEDYTYDPNGNLLTLQRHDDKAALQDDFHYGYYAATNRLREVKPINKDKVINGGEVRTDNVVYRNLTIQGNAYVPKGSKVEVKALENIYMDPKFEAHNASDFWAHIVTDEGTYQYDAIGNLILDQDQGVQISWTPYGKVREVRTKGDSIVVSYKYDATGNRVEKKVVRKTTDSLSSGEGRGEVITRYLHDAGGNVMAIYTDTTLIEQPLHGSSRLGMYRGGRKAGERTLGERNYELNNHLGNVLTVITDNVNMTPDSAWASVVSASDYYPFGLAMQGRTFSDTTYRYGFNGKEKDSFGDQVYDYGFRIYNPRIARFLSVDPLIMKYPELTPYQFASNRPIDGIDLDGLEYATFTILIHKGNVVDIKTSTDYELKAKGTKGAGIQYNYKVINDKGETVGSMPSKFVKNNIYGIYAGSENPQLPSKGGDYRKVHDDYRLDPIDEVDAAAKKHDLAYDKFELKGFGGIVDDLSSQANEDAANEAGSVMTRYKNANKNGTVAIDNVSGKKITQSEFEGACTVHDGFKAAEGVKAVKNAPGKAIKAVSNFAEDVKYKTIQGINSINNMATH